MGECILFAWRFVYPYDLEWMEGGVLLHGLRVMEGKPLYAIPTSDFICFIYPPLYYWLLALGGHLFGLDYPVGRFISIVGTLGAAWAIVSALRYEKAAWPVAIAGGTFFLSTYEDSGAFFDIVRTVVLKTGFFDKERYSLKKAHF